MSLDTALCADEESAVLPEGWALTHIGEVCEINPAKPAGDALPADAPVTFVPMPAVDAEQGAITAPQTSPFAEVRKGFTSFRNNDVIMAKITPCMENGKAAIARNLTNGLGFGSTEFHVLRPTMAVLPEYVYSFIRQESYRRAAESEMTGSVGQKRVPESFLELTEIPLPPPAEQVRIVQKVRAVLNAVKNATDKLSRAACLLKRFRQGVLAVACSGRLTEDLRTGVELGNGGAPFEQDQDEDEQIWKLPDGWHWRKLGDLAKVERGRFSVRPRNDPAYYDGKYPFVQIGDLPPDGGEISTFRQSLNDRGLAVSKCFPKGTVLIAIVGATIGNTGVLSFDSCCPDSLVAIQAKNGAMSRFIEYYLRWKKLKVRSESYASGGQPNINLQTLMPLPIPVPPAREVETIVNRVETHFQLAEQIEKKIAVSNRRCDLLKEAVLAKAFRGELVPTEAELARREGREYEPASVLLEHIRAERANQEKSPTVSKRKLRRASAHV